MKITKIKTIAAVITMSALLLANCGRANKLTTVVVAPDYSRQFAIDAALAVVINWEETEAIYFGDVKKSLGSANTLKDAADEAVILNYFTDRLLKDIMKEVDVKNAFVSEIKNNYRITKDVVSTLEEDITVTFPEAGSRLEFDSTEAALVLFLDKVRVGTQTDPYYVDRSQSGFYTTSGRKLIYLASFVLWDNRELKPICYGRVNKTVHISRDEATIANWEELSRTFVRTIFEPTGFLKRGGEVALMQK